MRAAAERLRDLAADRFGLRFDDDNLPKLEAVLDRRARVHRVSIDRYLAEVSADPSEWTLLAGELTIGETYFFRHYEQFLALRDVMLRAGAMSGLGARRTRLLSAGCSTGEEPYSLAMLAASLGLAKSGATIVGVDLNAAALRQAARGRYGSWSLRETPPDYASTYFSQDGKEFLLDPAIRQTVHLSAANLASPDDAIWAQEPFDIIFCRNVIMYFRPEVQKAVVTRLARLLAPGGHLVLGHAETLRGISTEFELRHTHGVFYYQRPCTECHTFTPSLPSNRPLETWSTSEIGKRIAARPKPPLIRRPASTGSATATQTAQVLSLLAYEQFAPALALLDTIGAPDDPDLLELRAVVLAQTGDFDAGAAVCRALLGHNPHNAGAYYVLALCSEGMRDDQAAMANYDLAAHVDPQFAMPVLRRALLHRRTHKRQDSRSDLIRASELLSHEAAARILLYGGGFSRETLLTVCASELAALEAAA